jgi:hypothetical protein
MKNNDWRDEEEKFLKENFSKLTLSKLAQSLDRSYSSVEHKVRNMGLKKTPVAGNSKPIVPVEEKPETEPFNYSEFLEELKDRISSVTAYQKKTGISLKKDGDTLVIHFTDWHVGRIVKNEQGAEIYNVKIFEERIDHLMTCLLKLLDEYIKKGTPIRDVVILSTGDILDGQGIFATQDTLSELSPPFQVMLALKAIQKLILALLERRLQVSFYGVKGNHGEIRENGKNRDPNANWDLMLYLILDYWSKFSLKSDKLNIHYSELDYLNFEIQGWKYHIRHIAPNQSETSAGKGKFLGWARKHGFNALVYGHFHHWGIWDRSGITVFRGGSVPGADEFSESLAEESEPIQLIWGVNTHRPMTFAYALDLGQRKK